VFLKKKQASSKWILLAELWFVSISTRLGTDHWLAALARWFH
jgi:hypothetical protein